MQRSENRQKHEEVVELLKKTEVKEELRRAKKKCVEYSIVGYKVVAAFTIIFGMCRREGV